MILRLLILISTFFIFTFSCYSSEPSEKWKSVDSLFRVHQVNAARTLMLTILDEGIKNKNDYDILRVYNNIPRTLYPIELEDRLELFLKLDSISQQLHEPINALTQLIMAEQMLINNRTWIGYRGVPEPIYSNNDTILFDTDKNRIEFIIRKLDQIINQKVELQKFEIKNLYSILSLERERQNTTVFDYIWLKLIYLHDNHFIVNQLDLKKAKEINESWLLNPDQFIDIEIKQNSLTEKVLMLYKDLEQFNLNDTLKLSHIHHNRLLHLVKDFNNSKKLEVWSSAINYYGEHIARTKFSYEKAYIKYQLGNKYHFKTAPQYKNELKEAYTLLKEELIKYPENESLEKMDGLMRTISHSSLSVNAPNNIYPADKLPILLKHKNLDSATVHIYKTDKKIDENSSIRNLFQNELIELIRTTEISLTDNKDFQTNSTEFLLDGLNSGSYLLFITLPDTDIQANADSLELWRDLPKSYVEFNVSEIFASVDKTNKGVQFLVTHFKTGKPISDVEINIYTKKHNEKAKFSKKIKTNSDGFASVELTHSNLFYEVIYKKSRIIYGDYFYNYNYNYGADASAKVLLDRSIYRPGQTVNYKVINYTGTENNFEVLKNEDITLIVEDASYQEVMKINAKTNEFGSADGSFVLPSSGPLGRYRINVEFKKKALQGRYNSHSFRVEEYKRPTFEVKLKQPGAEAKLNDSIHLTGNATAFAGYPISSATVNYRIYRKWNTYRWYSYFRSGNRDLVKDTNTITDKNGDFDLDFFAEIDPNAPDYARYNFEVIVEVTDISGETHQRRIYLNLTKTGLNLTFNSDTEFRTDQKRKAVLKVQNVAGIAQEGFEGELTIYRVKKQKLQLERIWEDAEYQNFDDSEWKKLFPDNKLSSFSEADDEKLEELQTISFKVGDSIDLNKLTNNQQGDYRIKAYSLTKNGDTLRTEQALSIIDVKSKKLTQSETLWTYLSSSSADVGDEIELKVGSSFKDAKAFIQLIRGKEVLESMWFELNEIESYCYKLKEEDRGNINFNIILIKNGNIYKDSKTISVPFNNKKLYIEPSVFRDELIPGQKEEWSFTVKGDDAEKVAAEFCATMYDASLDQISGGNYWSLWPYRGNYYSNRWNSLNQRSIQNGGSQGLWSFSYFAHKRNIPSFGSISIRGSRDDASNYFIDGIKVRGSSALPKSALKEVEEEVMAESADSENIVRKKEISESPTKDDSEPSPEPQNETSQVQVRENFNETAFFYPTLKTNENGEVIVSFVLPESLTSWKFLGLSHTKDMKVGQITLKANASKPLMVTANAPRFFRSNDLFEFSAKVVNTTDEKQKVDIEIEFFDPITSKPINLTAENKLKKTVTLEAEGAEDLNWDLDLNDISGLVAYKIIARSKDFSDGEQKAIPVLSQRQFITESQPFVITSKGETKLSFDQMKNNSSSTLKHERYSFEYTSNPSWNAVLALPYLADYPYECSEQIFSRYYANALANDVITKHPKIKTMFEAWKNISPEAFMSELEKNSELKSILLTETPWVLNAKSEAERRRRLGQLFEVNQLAEGQKNALHQLEQKQNGDGGFGWFGGSRSSIYITQHIVSGFGHLKNLGIELPRNATEIVEKAITFLNNHYLFQYKRLNDEAKKNYSVHGLNIHWLYASSYFEVKESKEVQDLKTLLLTKLEKKWGSLGLMEQALAGIVFINSNNDEYKNIILASLRDRSKTSPDGALYFPENQAGYYWYRDNIGTQAMIIEFYNQAEATQKEIDALRLWLLLNKRSNAWESTKATSLATYALLMKGTSYLSDDDLPSVKIGNEVLVFSENEATESKRYVSANPGLGHFKTSWSGSEINKELADIEIVKPTETPSYGAIYWQYFEDMDKVKAATNSEIQVKKKYRRVKAGSKGDEYEEDHEFRVGELVNIELIITAKNDMEFVHVKDLRPAGFEPTSNISRHSWQKGLWYYQSPKDASMNYFIDRLPKGTYTLNYEVFVTNAGELSGGNATIQCMYAPEFVSHSEGVKVSVTK